MKLKYLFILIFLPLSFSISYSNDSIYIDSLCNILRNMPLDTIRISQANKLFAKNHNNDYSYNLNNFSIQDSKSLKNNDMLVKGYYNNFRHYYNRTNMEKCSLYLDSIKLMKNNDYTNNFYFVSWKYYLELKAAKGDYEYVYNQSQSMRDEASNLNSKRGLVYSYFAEADFYRFTKNGEKTIELYSKSLNYLNPESSIRIVPYSGMISSYIRLKKYDEALILCDSLINILDIAVKKDPSKLEAYKGRYIRTYLNYATVYDFKKDYVKMKFYLDNASKFFDENCFISYYCNYNRQWASYHYNIGNYELAFEFVNKALDKNFEYVQPRITIHTLKLKAKILFKLENYKDAAFLYQNIAHINDSINTNVIEKQEETFRNNYDIEKELFEQVEQKADLRVIYNVFGGIVFFILLLFTVNYWKVLNISRKSLKETIKAKILAEESNKTKENFLRTLSNEIRVPLIFIVKFSKKLFNNPEMDKDTVSLYNTQISDYSNQLMETINNVLDLSRLEAGKTLLKNKSYNLVDLLSEIEYSVKNSDSDFTIYSRVPINQKLNINIDKVRFINMMIFMFTKLNPSDNIVRYSVIRKHENDEVLINIILNMKDKELNFNHSQHVMYEFHSLFVKLSGGSLRNEKKEDRYNLYISLPINNVVTENITANAMIN